jgi:hypothetical protein
VQPLNLSNWPGNGSPNAEPSIPQAGIKRTGETHIGSILGASPTLEQAQQKKKTRTLLHKEPLMEKGKELTPAKKVDERLHRQVRNNYLFFVERSKLNGLLSFFFF